MKGKSFVYEGWLFVFFYNEKTQLMRKGFNSAHWFVKTFDWLQVLRTNLVGDNSYIAVHHFVWYDTLVYTAISVNKIVFLTIELTNKQWPIII